MENIILPSSEMVNNYMNYGYLQSFEVGLKISLTLLPICILVLAFFYLKSKLEKKKK